MGRDPSRGAAYQRRQLLATVVTQLVELTEEEDDEAVEFVAELVAVAVTQLLRHEPMLQGS